MSKNDKSVYFNTPQRLTQLIGANTTVIVAGRRTGKTDSIASPFVLRNMPFYSPPIIGELSSELPSGVS